MGIFKTPSPQKFEYNPRFWNPRKEELEDRLNELKKLKENGVEASKARISKGLRHSYRMDQKAKAKYITQSNLRLLVIVMVLLAISLYIIYVYLPKIEAYLYGNPI